MSTFKWISGTVIPVVYGYYKYFSLSQCQIRSTSYFRSYGCFYDIGSSWESLLAFHIKLVDLKCKSGQCRKDWEALTEYMHVVELWNKRAQQTNFLTQRIIPIRHTFTHTAATTNRLIIQTKRLDLRLEFTQFACNLSDHRNFKKIGTKLSMQSRARYSSEGWVLRTGLFKLHKSSRANYIKFLENHR